MAFDLKPIAQTMGIGSLVGGAIGGVFGGPSGLVAGANFAGSLGAQLGLYSKAEDLTDRAAKAAGEKFEDISERIAQRAINHLDVLAERLTNGFIKVVNVYTKMSVTGYTASWAIDLSSRAGYSATGFCANEKEWQICAAYTTASYLLLGVAVCSGLSLAFQMIKINKKGVINERIKPGIQTANTSSQSEPVQKKEKSRANKQYKPQETGIPTAVPIQC